MEPWVLTTKEVSKLLGVSRTSVRRYGASGKLPSVAVGPGQRLFSLDGVEQFLKERKAVRSKRRRPRGKTNGN
jgi:excisionase family DNA binding protein